MEGVLCQPWGMHIWTHQSRLHLLYEEKETEHGKKNATTERRGSVIGWQSTNFIYTVGIFKSGSLRRLFHLFILFNEIYRQSLPS